MLCLLQTHFEIEDLFANYLLTSVIQIIEKAEKLNFIKLDSSIFFPESRRGSQYFFSVISNRKLRRIEFLWE